MSSNAGILVQGLLSSEHTTNANSQYSNENIPTPWPLVLFSVLLSFIIMCCAAIFAAISLDKTPTPVATNSLAPKPTSIPLQTPGSKPFRSKGRRPKVSTKIPWAWLCYYITVVYCTFRAIAALIVCLKIRIENTTPLPAPSAILMALIATQIVHCNVRHHPLTRLILTLDIVALTIAFGFCGYLLGSSGWSRYGTLLLEGGNCAVPASDCLTQAPSWISVGCDNYIGQPWMNEQLKNGYAQQFNVPYSIGGHVNDVNSLRTTEEGVIVIGTIWFLFVFSQLCDTINILIDIFSGGSSSTGWNYTRPTSILGRIWNIIKRLSPRTLFSSRTCKIYNETQRNMYYYIIGGGFIFGILVMLMGIGGHSYQMNNKQKVRYLDCFGPVVGTNLTFNGNGVLIGTNYFGNATNWCDCFDIRAPGSRSGFWSEWVGENSKAGTLYRIAGGF